MALPHSEGPTAAGCTHAKSHTLMESGTFPSFISPFPAHIFLQPWVENLTGTRGAYRPYNTAKPKIEAWQPKVVSRTTPPPS